MALKAGYVGVKRWLYEALTKESAENAQGITNLWANNALMGAKNRVPFPYYDGMSKSADGVTFTVDENGVIDVDTSGQASTATTSFVLMNTTARYNDGYLLLGKSQYSNTDVRLQYYDATTGDGFNATEDGVLIQNTNGHNCRLVILVQSGKTISHAKFYPMISIATDPSTTYVPYAMTNKELTDNVQQLTGSADDQKTAINAIITAATGAADFAAFKTAMAAITPVTRSVAPETRGEVEDDPEPVTRKSTKKTTTKEGE